MFAHTALQLPFLLCLGRSLVLAVLPCEMNCASCLAPVMQGDSVVL